MGYGTRALQALDAFYSGQLLNLNEVSKAVQGESFEQALQSSKVSSPRPMEQLRPQEAHMGSQGDELHSEELHIRDPSRMPPLLHRLAERQPERLDYLGVSYGLTPTLFRFWKRSRYVPLYLRQTQSELTGEHTCIMVRGLSSTRESTAPWLLAFAQGLQLPRSSSKCLLSHTFVLNRLSPTLHLFTIVQVS